MPIFSEQLPPWLTHQPDILDAARQGQDAGAAQVRNFTSAYNESFAQKKAALLLPLQMEQQRIQNESSAAHLTTQMNVLQDKATTDIAVAKWAESAASIAREGKWLEPETEGTFDDLMTKYPVLATDKFQPLVQQTYSRIATARAFDNKQKEDALNRASLEKRTQMVADERAAAAADRNATTLNVAEIRSATQKYSADNRTKIQSMIADAHSAAGRLNNHLDEIAMKGEVHSLVSSLAGKMMSPEEVQAKIGEIKGRYKEASPAKSGSSQYKVGGVYEGGLKYLGGNPEDESSWEQVR